MRTIEALRFNTDPSSQAQQVLLTARSAEDLKKQLVGDGPVAYLVRNDDLGVFQEFPSVFIDRGSKGETKELARVLLGQKLIPFVRGSYRHAGRVVQGIEDLLARAQAKSEHNAYIIGADNTIFDKLWSGRRGSAKRAQPACEFTAESVGGVLTPQLVLKRIPKREVPDELRRRWYVGAAPLVELVRQWILIAGESDEPVLITGPTGSGKDNVARAIHYFGARKGNPFVAVNTAAILSTLFESELFGFVRGAFTGAVRNKEGFWEAAGAGTLFLDEIGDLDLDLQKKILRALDHNEVIRVGATKPIEVGARVVTATNRDLDAMVQSGQFRADLYYRLRVIKITTPALHEHPEDIDELAQFLWQRITQKKTGATVAEHSDAKLSRQIIARLEAYRWPGNVRELHQVLARLYFLFRKIVPVVEDLEMVFALEGQSVGSGNAAPASEHELALHCVECLRQLRQADEVIRACQVTLQPVLEKKRTDRETLDAVHRTLHYRLHELDLLCLHPLLFHSDVTFEVVDRLGSRLAHLHERLQHPAEAVRYFNKELTSEFKLALSAIFKEVERVMEGH